MISIREAGEQRAGTPAGRAWAALSPSVPQVDVVSRSGERIPVSVWMKRVKQESSLCCVVVLEPVERVSAWVAFRSDVSHVRGPSFASPYPLGPPSPAAPAHQHMVSPGALGQEEGLGPGGCAWLPW